MWTVIKRDHHSRETLRYTGALVAQGTNYACLRAPFMLSDRDLGYVTLCQGDVFTEWFYTDRWYNVFRIEDRTTQALKGWYCNFTRPAQITAGVIAADDLALDLFVYPDGRTLLLDEAEFYALCLEAAETTQVLAAVQALMALAAARIPPLAP